MHTHAWLRLLLLGQCMHSPFTLCLSWDLAHCWCAVCMLCCCCCCRYWCWGLPPALAANLMHTVRVICCSMHTCARPSAAAAAATGATSAAEPSLNMAADVIDDWCACTDKLQPKLMHAPIAAAAAFTAGAAWLPKGCCTPRPCIWRIEGVTLKNEIMSTAPEALLASHMQGYRAPSPCIWRIEGVTSKNEIVSIAPEALADGSMEGFGGFISSKGGKGAGTKWVPVQTHACTLTHTWAPVVCLLVAYPCRHTHASVTDTLLCSLVHAFCACACDWGAGWKRMA